MVFAGRELVTLIIIIIKNFYSPLALCLTLGVI